MPELYQPQLEDLWFKAQLLGDEQTMSYNHAWGGTIAFPESRWAAWYDRWIVHHEGKRFYRYIRADGVFVGEAAYHFDEEQQIYLADVIIFAAHRGKGYGRAGLQLLCDSARARGVTELYDSIASDNPGVALFLHYGFEEVLRTGEYILVRKSLTD